MQNACKDVKNHQYIMVKKVTFADKDDTTSKKKYICIEKDSGTASKC